MEAVGMEEYYCTKCRQTGEYQEPPLCPGIWVDWDWLWDAHGRNDEAAKVLRPLRLEKERLEARDATDWVVRSRDHPDDMTPMERDRVPVLIATRQLDDSTHDSRRRQRIDELYWEEHDRARRMGTALPPEPDHWSEDESDPEDYCPPGTTREGIEEGRRLAQIIRHDPDEQRRFMEEDLGLDYREQIDVDMEGFGRWWATRGHMYHENEANQN